MKKISSKQFQTQTKFAVSNFRMMINLEKQGMWRLRKNCIRVPSSSIYMNWLFFLTCLYFSLLRLSRFHLRLTRDTNPLTKRLIVMSLGKILDQCTELRLLPSVILKQVIPSKRWVIPRTDKNSLARNRCIRFSNVLAYAQLILC